MYEVEIYDTEVKELDSLRISKYCCDQSDYDSSRWFTVLPRSAVSSDAYTIYDPETISSLLEAHFDCHHDIFDCLNDATNSEACRSVLRYFNCSILTSRFVSCRGSDIFFQRIPSAGHTSARTMTTLYRGTPSSCRAFSILKFIRDFALLNLLSIITDRTQPQQFSSLPICQIRLVIVNALRSSSEIIASISPRTAVFRHSRSNYRRSPVNCNQDVIHGCPVKTLETFYTDESTCKQRARSVLEPGWILLVEVVRF